MALDPPPSNVRSGCYSHLSREQVRHGTKKTFFSDPFSCPLLRRCCGKIPGGACQGFRTAYNLHGLEGGTKGAAARNPVRLPPLPLALILRRAAVTAPPGPAGRQAAPQEGRESKNQNEAKQERTIDRITADGSQPRKFVSRRNGVHVVGRESYRSSNSVLACHTIGSSMRGGCRKFQKSGLGTVQYKRCPVPCHLCDLLVCRGRIWGGLGMGMRRMEYVCYSSQLRLLPLWRPPRAA